MGKVQLRDANLRRANLRFADLKFADLRDANLSGSNLNNAALDGANPSGADLTDTNVEAALFTNTSGISDSLKQDLIQRGAIFEDNPLDPFRIRVPSRR